MWQVVSPNSTRYYTRTIHAFLHCRKLVEGGAYLETWKSNGSRMSHQKVCVGGRVDIVTGTCDSEHMMFQGTIQSVLRLEKNWVVFAVLRTDQYAGDQDSVFHLLMPVYSVRLGIFGTLYHWLFYWRLPDTICGPFKAIDPIRAPCYRLRAIPSLDGCQFVDPNIVVEEVEDGGVDRGGLGPPLSGRTGRAGALKKKGSQAAGVNIQAGGEEMGGIHVKVDMFGGLES